MVQDSAKVTIECEHHVRSHMHAVYRMMSFAMTLNDR